MTPFQAIEVMRSQSAFDDDDGTLLLYLMSGYSEEWWSAGWLLGLEHSLWEKITDDDKYEQNRCDEPFLTAIATVAYIEDGWYHWPNIDDYEAPVRVSLDEWRKCAGKIERWDI